MAKEIEWSKLFGVGEVVCNCDNCSAVEGFEFEGNNPDYKNVQSELRKLGWLSCKVHGKWHDFCYEECRNRYIKAHRKGA